MPILSRSCEEHCELRPALLCSCTRLGEEYTPVIPAPAAWAPARRHSEPQPKAPSQAKPAKPSRATAVSQTHGWEINACCRKALQLWSCLLLQPR